MNTIYNFAFVETTDSKALTDNIVYINKSRHHRIEYKRILQTAPRREWSALILDNNNPDHYLLRNLSGRLQTRAFEFGMNGVRLFYRVHKLGRTASAYESHLGLWVTQELRSLMNTGDVMGLDLAEPAGRLVLRRYHEHQRNRAWTHQNSAKLPASIEEAYAGSIDDIQDLFAPKTSLAYIQEILAPGFSAQTALERLVEAFALPYLAGDVVEVHNAQGESVRTIEGYDILKPSTWHEGSALPTDWLMLTHKEWEKD
jgi:hypothetical protein